MQTKPISEMTAEHATYILRRKPATEWERELACQAVRTLARSGLVLGEIQVDVMRNLSADELAVYHAERQAIDAANQGLAID